MKIYKLFMIATVAATLMSCNGTTSEDSTSSSSSSSSLEEAVLEESEAALDELEDELEELEELEEELEETESSSASEDWDSILDEYEEYVDDYIATMRKASEGDMTAMTDAMSMMETAQSLSSKLENARGSLSPSQMSRYMNIVQKMSSAAM